MKRKFLNILFLFPIIGWAQNSLSDFESFQNEIHSKFNNFREKINQEYVDFLKKSWDIFEEQIAIPQPVEPAPLPPQPYVEPPAPTPKPEPIRPITVKPIKTTPKPQPIAPINETPVIPDEYLDFDFYGTTLKVRAITTPPVRIKSTSANSVAEAWKSLSDGRNDNLVSDCLSLRSKHNLSDWEYLLLLEELSKTIYRTHNESILLTAWLFSQSGYQTRIAASDTELGLYFGSQHIIYNRNYIIIDGFAFYPFKENYRGMAVARAAYPGEKPLSLLIENEPLAGNTFTPSRRIESGRYPDISVESQVKKPLIDFFDTYPTSAIGGNIMTRWAMYANTPLSKETKNQIYPQFLEKLEGMSKLEAAERLLNWVQTGFEYEYDDNIWGGDRAFFAEETLYYPYSDCEDRAILFSRLVRDLLGLKTALVYYPGHLATAVRFNQEVNGTGLIIDNEKYIVCDPTYIGAPVGAQMPGLDLSRVQAIILN